MKFKVLFLLLVPTLAFFIINNYIPMIGIYYAFTKFNIKGGLFGSPFIGLDNFKFLYQSNILFNITKNTISYNLVFIILTNAISHLLLRKTHGANKI